MELGRQLALTRPWWMWQDRGIQEALSKAKLRHWLPLVRRALKANKAAGRSPASMKELSGELYLARDPRNIGRVEAGEYALTDQHLLGFAVGLDMPLPGLLPEACDWISAAVRILCPQLSPAEARAYTLYRLASMPGGSARCDPDLDREAIRKVLHEMKETWGAASEVGKVIRNVADHVGAVLVRVQEAQ